MTGIYYYPCVSRAGVLIRPHAGAEGRERQAHRALQASWGEKAAVVGRRGGQTKGLDCSSFVVFTE